MKLGIHLTQLITKRKSCGAGSLARGRSPFLAYLEGGRGRPPRSRGTAPQVRQTSLGRVKWIPSLINSGGIIRTRKPMTNVVSALTANATGPDHQECYPKERAVPG